MGGLVVKQALIIAKNKDKFADIKKQTYGLVFLQYHTKEVTVLELEIWRDTL